MAAERAAGAGWLPAAAVRSPGGGAKAQAGFTLVEMMVVVVILALLIILGAPVYSDYVLDGNVKQAIPTLRRIGEKQVTHFKRTGRYLATHSEDDIQRRLGIDLSKASDFCFRILCIDDAVCGKYTTDGGNVTTLGKATEGGSFLGSPGNVGATKFQVVAYLRRVAADYSAQDAGTCKVGTQPAKANPTGWVQPTGTGKAARGGVVIYSYPEPPDSDPLWVKGINLHDALD